MSRTFAYARVSTFDQTPENQIREIETAGFAVGPHRLISETISGSMAIAQREGFSKLLDKIEKGDILIVTKLDRLGRAAIDVSTLWPGWKTLAFACIASPLVVSILRVPLGG